MAIFHVNQETLSNELQKRGFTRDIAERAVAALASPDEGEPN
jgi:hypothetical protein